MDSLKKERYKRQIQMPEIGIEGQNLLAEKKVLIIGAGGLGTPCAAYLSGAGIGHIEILDDDNVSLSNLPRQILYSVNDIGRPKAEVLSEKLRLSNPLIDIVPTIKRLTPENAIDAIKGFDVVASCVDNQETRYLLNHACVDCEIPLVDGAVSGFTGIIFSFASNKGPCYRCLFPDQEVQVKKSSIIGPTAGVIGCLQASEALKLVLNIGSPLVDRFIFLDLLSGAINTVSAKKDPNCPVCRKS